MIFSLFFVVVAHAALDWSERVTIRNAVHGHFSMPRFIGRGVAAEANSTLVRRRCAMKANRTQREKRFCGLGDV